MLGDLPSMTAEALKTRDRLCGVICVEKLPRCSEDALLGAFLRTVIITGTQRSFFQLEFLFFHAVFHGVLLRILMWPCL